MTRSCALILAVLLLAACGSSSPPDPSGTAVRQPAHPNGRLVVYVHGAGETQAALDAPDKKAILDRLSSEGYTIAASRAHGDNWGTPRSVDDYAKLIDSEPASAKRNGVYLLAQSMGGFDALELLGRVKVKAWAGIYPACNMSAIDPYGAPGVVDGKTIAAGIKAVYPHGAPASVSPVKVTNLRGLPMIWWASYGDHIVPRRGNTDVCAAEAQAAGAKVTVVTTTGEHGDPSNFDPARLAAFFDAA